MATGRIFRFRQAGGRPLQVVLWLLVISVVGVFAWILWEHGNRLAKNKVPGKELAVNKPNAIVQPSTFNLQPPTSKPQPSTSNPPASLPNPALRERVLRAQVALVRQRISPGSLDGLIGPQTRAAVRAFQGKENLPGTGDLDASTWERLAGAPLTPSDGEREGLPPLYRQYVVSEADLARLQPLGKTWLAKSQQSRLDYESILELVAEKSLSHPNLICWLNPQVTWSNVTPGTMLKIPNTEFPPVTCRATFVRISLSSRMLEAFDEQTNLLAHFPCSIGQRMEQRPAGELHVVVVAFNPNYTFDPEVFPESAEGRELGRKLILPPGPNNPVGVVWIGLDKPGYGIHGTPRPEQVGRTESHGCFRLANWNAEYLARMVWVGMPVVVE